MGNPYNWIQTKNLTNYISQWHHNYIERKKIIQETFEHIALTAYTLLNISEGQKNCKGILICFWKFVANIDSN